jgi:hypothetical protein
LLAEAADFDQKICFVTGETGAGQGKFQLLADRTGFAGEARDEGWDVFHYGFDFAITRKTFDV